MQFWGRLPVDPTFDFSRIAASLLIFLTSARAAAASPEQWMKCADCHQQEAREFTASVHNGKVQCQECHGGSVDYVVTVEQAARYEQGSQRPPFDHGKSFRGKSSRSNIPGLCGNCHANVEQMNQYGLRTDQLSSYRVSGHGRRLESAGDDRVAVCIDCHGGHEILRPDDPKSRIHFRNIPATCGQCHADETLMSEFGLSSTIIAEYTDSVHGKAVLERGDAGAPTCASCHGSHGAAPPGYANVGHVCGQCHQQTEQHFLQSMHGRLPNFPRCIGCHSGAGDLRNHRIDRAMVHADELRDIYKSARSETASEDALKARFRQGISAISPTRNLDATCARCHATQRVGPHAQFFAMSDQEAVVRAQEFDKTLSEAEFRYAATAVRVEELGRGVLLVRDESLQIEEVKTDLIALQSFLHTGDAPQVRERVDKISRVCGEIDSSFDRKIAGLSQRRMTVLLVWIFGSLFSILMYRKYMELRRRYVATAQPVPAGCALPQRRRFLDMVVRGMGGAGALILLWPAVAYMLPARKRGGGHELVKVGSEADWQPWTARKVAVEGKPVGVVRTDKGYQAVSLVCTHLGCIVHWDGKTHEFLCPCHAARFGSNGEVIAGPPPRPLPQYAINVVQGEVVVSGAKE